VTTKPPLARRRAALQAATGYAPAAAGIGAAVRRCSLWHN
jgi:hypothetical protein